MEATIDMPNTVSSLGRTSWLTTNTECPDTGTPKQLLRGRGAVLVAEREVDDRLVGERVGDDDVFLAVTQRVVVGEVPVGRGAVGARADGAAVGVVGLLLDEARRRR